MLVKRLQAAPDRAARPSAEDSRWLLVDLEAAQRRNVYAAGSGDRPRTARHWTRRLTAKRGA